MQVAQYTFQSPSPNAVQVGRLDPSSLKEEKAESKTAPVQQPVNETLQKAQQFQATQVSEVKPSINESSSVKSNNGKSEIAKSSQSQFENSQNTNAANNANANAAFNRPTIDLYV